MPSTASTLTLSLNANDIKLAVKSDTYITGQIDKSADMTKNAAVAFNEQAGDESYHETKLYRTMKGALAKFESQLAEYVETSNASAEIQDNLTQALGDFSITLTVNNRISSAFAKPLAYLAQEYIINTMLYYWWQPIKPTLAKDYLSFAMDNIADVRRCLAKSAPSTSTASYDDIHGSVLSQVYMEFSESEVYAEAGIVFEDEPELTIEPSDLTVTYSSSNETVATVNETTGQVVARAAGDATITASFAGNSEYSPCTASYILHVTAPTPISVNP